MTVSSSPRRPAPAVPAQPSLRLLHEHILGCRSCCREGLLAACAPVLCAPSASRMMLVGQAPGRLEVTTRRPFSGRAGRELFRWLKAAGLGTEEEARAAVYLTSITKCFPGAASSGSGDRRPSSREIELCRPHLEAQLSLLAPWLVIAVGQLAISRFLGRRSMDEVVGRVYLRTGSEHLVGAPVPADALPLLLPLPHPSGASRWLNQPQHRDQLARALAQLGRLREAPPGLSAPI